MQTRPRIVWVVGFVHYITEPEPPETLSCSNIRRDLVTNVNLGWKQNEDQIYDPCHDK